MLVEAIGVKFLKGVTLEVSFIDGSVVRYDMAKMFDKYPQLKELENRSLFESGYLTSDGYAIIWNDELDFSTTSIYENGEKVGSVSTSINQQLGFHIAKAREKAGLTQVELAKLTGIDQGDISKLERGQGNPSLKKINKILKGLNADITISIK